MMHSYLSCYDQKTIVAEVLILVLMDDALVLEDSRICRQRNHSLNPCFNG